MGRSTPVVIDGEFTEVILTHVGRMNGVFPPVGTIVGPNPRTLEYMTVVATDESGVLLQTTSRHDWANANVRAQGGEINSLAEHRMYGKIHS